MTGAADLTSVSVLKTETLLFFTLLQLTAIVLAARLGGMAARRLGQSPAVGEIVAGILLGPTLAGLVSPQAFAYVFQSTPPEPLQILAQVGLLLLMFQIGLEFEFSHLLEGRNRTAVIRVAAAGLAAPFALGLAFGYATAPILSPEADRLASGLFVATAFSITALPILGRIMIELGVQRTALGVIAISAAAINDVVGWLVLALVTTLALARFEALGFTVQVLLLVAYLLGAWWLVRPLLRRIVARAGPSASHLPPGLLGVVLAAVFLSGMATIELGIFGIFGGFLMGVLLHRETGLVEAWRTRVEPFVLVFFLPIFFTYTGLRTDIGGLDGLAAWGWLRPTAAAGPSVYDAALPDSARMAFAAATSTTGYGAAVRNLSIAPSGDFAVYAARQGESAMLWYRSLRNEEAHPINGTAGGNAPRVSPDGKQVAFLIGNRVAVVPVEGGEPRTLLESQTPTFLDWVSPTSLLVGSEDGYRVDWVDPEAGTVRHKSMPRCVQGRWSPELRLLTCRINNATAIVDPEAGTSWYVHTTAPDGGEGTLVTGSGMRILGGTLLTYVSADGEMRAAPYDNATHRIGRPVTLSDGVRTEAVGEAHYDVAADGTLVFAPGVLLRTIID